MTRLCSVVFPPFFLALLAFSCSKGNMGGSVATVGGRALSSNELKKILSDEQKDSLFVFNYISEWVEKELLFLGALSVGIDKDLATKQKINNYKTDVLGASFLKLKKKNVSVTKKEINTYYNKLYY